MAEKRYSSDDQQKMIRDKAADWRAKGIDAVDVNILHPGGTLEGIRSIEKDLGYTREQAQSQQEQGRERIKQKRQLD